MAINGVMAELGRVAFANPIDELAFDADGDPHPKFPSGSRCKAAPITALQVEEYQGSDGSGRRPVKRVIFKSEDKLDALVKLADLLTASTLAR